MPEKSGMDAALWLSCCVNAVDEKRVAAEIVAMMNVRTTDSSR
jgi:hypothetical protein